MAIDTTIGDMSVGADLVATIPDGDLAEKWDNYKFDTKLVKIGRAHV